MTNLETNDEEHHTGVALEEPVLQYGGSVVDKHTDHPYNKAEQSCREGKEGRKGGREREQMTRERERALREKR